MGLLDSLFNSPSQQALWALGSGLLGVRKGNEGRALMGGMDAYNQAQQEQRRNELVQLQRKQIEAQLAEREAEQGFWRVPGNFMGPGQSAFPPNEMDPEGSPASRPVPLPPQMVAQNMLASGVPSLAKTGFGAMQKEVRPPVVVGKGGALVDSATGLPLFTNQDSPGQWEQLPTKSSGGQLLIRNKATGEIKAVGSGPLVVNNNNPAGPGGQRPPTKMETKFDELAAKELSDWALGGSADAKKQIATLRRITSRLTPGSDLTGGMVGVTPDKVLPYTNAPAADAKDNVEEVVTRNLRLILGAQFTEKEGARLIARAYNPALRPEQNKVRLDALMKQMEAAAQAKDDAMAYFEQNGTLQGWKGKKPSIDDFYDAIDNAGAVGGPVGGGWKIERAN